MKKVSLKDKLTRARGFTAVELVVATAVLAVVMSLMLGIYISGLRVWDLAREEADLRAQARQAMEFMVSELRNATRTSTRNPSPNLSIPSSPNNKNINFRLPADNNGDGLLTDANGQIEWDTNNPIDYQYVPGQRLLRRLEKGAQTVIAEDVQDIQFIDIGIDPTLSVFELRIILTLNKTTERQRSISATLSSIVRLRN